MNLKAKQDGEVIIFELEGQLDFETTQQFQTTCESLIRKNNTRRVVFNLDRLKFVGSSGINQFIKVLKAFNGTELRPKICHLSSEFQKVFKAYQTARNPFEIYENEKEAILSFDDESLIKKALKKKLPTAELT
jgi:anti-anti-sigma factor